MAVWMPSRSKNLPQLGVSDSASGAPICASGFVTRVTRWPHIASSRAAVQPAGPAPRMRTSGCSEVTRIEYMRSDTCAKIPPRAAGFRRAAQETRHACRRSNRDLLHPAGRRVRCRHSHPVRPGAAPGGRCDAAEAAGRGVGHLRTGLRRDASQPADQHRSDQRHSPRAGVVGRGRVPGQDRDHAPRARRRPLRHVHVERGLRHRRPHRHVQVALGSRAGEGRLRRGWPARLLRARSTAASRSTRGKVYVGLLDGRLVALECTDRACGLGRADHPGGQRLHHHRRAAHRQGQGADRQRRRRVRRARLPHRLRRGDRQAGVALVRRARRPGARPRGRIDGARGQDLERRVVEVRRRRHAVGRHHLRPGVEPGLRRHRQRLAVGARPPQPGRRRQPLPLVHRRASTRETGQYVWHYQTTPGDDWDYNAAQHDDPGGPDDRRRSRARC